MKIRIDIQVEHWPISRLIPRVTNPRTHTPEQIAQVAASMKEFGWTNPILVGADNDVLAGHARLLAARQLGMTEVPVIQLGHLSEAQRRALVALAAFLALGAFLAAVVFLVALPLAGAPLAACARPLAFRWAFGFSAGCSAWASAVWPRPLMRSQIRAMAVLLLLKPSTGVTPGRVFQMATSRSTGHALASSASSFWLLKLSKGVVVAAAASSGVANATISFCSLMVKVVIVNLLRSALCAVITWITRKCLKGKAIIRQSTMANGWRSWICRGPDDGRWWQMRGHGAKLPRKQEAAIAALLYNRTVEEAAKSIDVNPNTLRRWMELPEFEEAYLRVRREAVRQTYARLQQNSGAAGSVLLKLMADSSTKASTRVQAAKCILEIAGKSLETDDVLMRLARLEQSEQKRGRN